MMSPRQRLLTALRRGMPDRVPVTIYEHSPYNDDWPNRDPSYAPLLELERAYGDSFVFLPTAFPVFWNDDDETRVRTVRTQAADGSVVRDVTIDTPAGPLHSVFRRDPGLMTSWQVEHFIKSDADIARVLSLPDPPLHFDPAAIRAWTRRVGEGGVLCPNPGDAVGRVVGLFDYSDFVLRCRKDDGPIRALLDKAQEQLLRAVRAIGPAFQDAAFRLWGPEYCGAPLMNPRTYFRRYVVERDKALTQAIHDSGNLSVIHCHGMLGGVLDMIVETGADALEPLETLPMPTADVTLAEIKRRVGDRLCLMGAVQARTLETGTPAELRAEVQAALQSGAPGGGFVLLPTSAPFMTPLTPRCLENAGMMYHTAHELGRYAR
jgi:hypothetical protein